MDEREVVANQLETALAALERAEATAENIESMSKRIAVKDDLYHAIRRANQARDEARR